jgi:hypothetical protein
MRRPHVDGFVRLTHDIPELSLSRGDVGVVRSTWFAPTVAYEVEFNKIGNDYQCRALLLEEQVEADEAAPAAIVPASQGMLCASGE